MDILVDIALLAFLAATAIAVVRTTNLFAAVMLAGIYSLLTAGLFTVMDAVDVAFTEAAVGAGLATVLFLATLALVESRVKTPQTRITDISAKVPDRRPVFPLVVVCVTGAILVYGTLDLPPYGAADNPIHSHVATRYLQESGDEIGVPNVVTSVLASYRGFDTLGEVTVVFTAAVGVMILLSGMRKKDGYGEEQWGEEDVPDLIGPLVAASWNDLRGSEGSGGGGEGGPPSSRGGGGSQPGDEGPGSPGEGRGGNE